jgi:hypothetical protein
MTAGALCTAIEQLCTTDLPTMKQSLVVKAAEGGSSSSSRKTGGTYCIVSYILQLIGCVHCTKQCCCQLQLSALLVLAVIAAVISMCTAMVTQFILRACIVLQNRTCCVLTTAVYSLLLPFCRAQS